MLGLAHAEKPFTLYVHEGVVTSHRSPEPKAGTASETSGLLSKTNALGGPGMAELAVGSSSPVNEVSKLTLRQHLGLLTPYQVQSVLEVKGHHWQTGRKVTRYQTLLTNILDITFKVYQTLNPATLLPVVKSGDLTHQCMRTCSVMSDSLQPHGLQPARLLCPWSSPGKNSGVGCHYLLQGIFPTQVSNPGLLNCRQISYRLSHQGS